MNDKIYLSRIPSSVPELLKDLNDELRIFHDDKIEVWFAPLGHTNTDARIAIFGITPGWTQMKAAYKAEINRRNGKKKDFSQIAFAGSMRKNLVDMLDAINIHDAFDVASSSALFQSSTLHSSSILKFPVFKNGVNYAGSSPSPLKHPFLLEMVNSILADELRSLSHCLVIPLGKAANEVVQYLNNVIPPSCRVLYDFPHPSGASGHRVRLLEERKEILKETVRKWRKYNYTP